MKARVLLQGTLVALLALFSGPAGLALAHSYLVRSDPQAGEVLRQFPEKVRLEFSEDVDPASVLVQLLDDSGNVLEDGVLTISPINPTLVIAAFQPRPDGVYSLRWRVLSAIDAHFTEGTVAFSVGVEMPKASLLPPPGTPDPASDLPPLSETLLRALGYLSISLVAGCALFGVAAWRPAIQSGPGGIQALDGYFTRLARAILFWSAIAAALSLFGLQIWQGYRLSAMAGGAPAAPSADQSVGVARSVWIFWGQVLLLFALWNMGNALPSLETGRPAMWWAASGTGAALLFLYSLSGHNASIGLLPVAGDWLHLLAVSAWIGGLPLLALVLLRQRRAAAAGNQEGDELVTRVVKRFSRLALFSVILLGLSGIYSALLQVKTWEALLQTRYGQAILLKSGLFAILIGYGALNQRVLLPAMARSNRRAFRWLGRTVWMEYGLGIALLLVVGALMSLSPGYAALQLERSMGFHGRYEEGGAQVDLRIAPARVGENEIGVDISDRRPGGEQSAPTVLVRIQPPGDPMDITQVDPAPASDGRFTARGSYFSQPGEWMVEVILRKTGMDDIDHTFTVVMQR